MRRTIWALVAALGVATLGATGCSSDGDAAPATTAPDADPTETSTSVTTTSGPPVGEPISRFSLQLGDCFNVYDDIDVTTRVPCETPHDREVFHTESHPAPHGEPYPGDREMEHHARRACYAQFEAFAGVLYELSRLDIGAITPTKANFEDSRARYRGITCYVQDTDREPLVGSMRGRAE